MVDAEPTLLLIRPETQSRAFLAECEATAGHRLKAVVSPIIRIEDRGALPDLDNYTGVILTSANGVRRLGPVISGRKVATVGSATAILAQSFGARARAYGENVSEFLTQADFRGESWLYCHGVHMRGNLGKALRETGALIEEAVVYDQVAQPLSQVGLEILSSNSKVLLPLFSPRSAKLMSDYVITTRFKVIAISENTAEAWTGGGEICIAERPDAEAMKDAVLKSF